jgi:hypothetical protein
MLKATLFSDGKMDSSICVGKNRKGQQTACKLARLRPEITITHPFHPRYSEKFTLLSYGRPRGRVETIILLDARHTTVSLPLSWTDAGEMNAFAMIAEGRSWFRAGDLARLASLMKGLVNDIKKRKAL